MMDVQQKWAKANKMLITECGLSMADMPSVVQDKLKDVFVEAVELHHLSFESSVALFYGLYYFGQVSLMEMIKLGAMPGNVGPYTDPGPLLQAQARWVAQAADYATFWVAMKPVAVVTEKLLEKLQKD
mgnify:FL=1